MSSPVQPLRIDPLAPVISIDGASPTKTGSTTERKAPFPPTASTLESPPYSPSLFLAAPPLSPVLRVPEVRSKTLLPDGTEYEGTFENGKAEGRGTAIFPPEHILSDYEGEFHNGLAHGQGTANFRTGGSYKGEMRAGQISGTGTLIYAAPPPGYNKSARHTYKGELENSKPQGKGEMRYTDGSKYNGSFNQGTWHGQGAYAKPNGYRVEGVFNEGKLWNGTISKRTEAGIITRRYNEGNPVLDCSCVIL